MPSDPVPMSDSARGLSRSVEDYLKAIYGISERGDAASTSAIAEVLAVQPASVTGMVKRLAESGLLEHVPYRGVRLTASGNKEALRVLRRHRIIETYLCDRLGYSWDDVHEEAERLEHAVSDGLIERMAAAIDFPSHDPHGAPIPTSGGEIETTDSVTLADVGKGAVVRIRAVLDEDSERLRLLEAEGLTPGVRMRVEASQEARRGVLVCLLGEENERRSVPADVARRIFVVLEAS